MDLEKAIMDMYEKHLEYSFIRGVCATLKTANLGKSKTEKILTEYEITKQMAKRAGVDDLDMTIFGDK